MNPPPRTTLLCQATFTRLAISAGADVVEMGETVDLARQQLDRHRRTTGFGPIRSGCCHPSRAIACGCLTPALRREHQGRSPASATVEARRQCRTRILILTDEHHINVINAATGEVLRDFTFDPTRDYQPTGAPKGPKRKNRGPKVGPRLFRCLATSPSSGDSVLVQDIGDRCLASLEIDVSGHWRQFGSA